MHADPETRHSAARTTADDDDDALARQLAALPVRAPEAIAAERTRLRARMALHRKPASPALEAIARGWYVAEPWVAGAAVAVLLVWTFERMSRLLVG